MYKHPFWLTPLYDIYHSFVACGTQQVLHPGSPPLYHTHCHLSFGCILVPVVGVNTPGWLQIYLSVYICLVLYIGILSNTEHTISLFILWCWRHCCSNSLYSNQCIALFIPISHHARLTYFWLVFLVTSTIVPYPVAYSRYDTLIHLHYIKNLATWHPSFGCIFVLEKGVNTLGWLRILGCMLMYSTLHFLGYI